MGRILYKYRNAWLKNVEYPRLQQIRIVKTINSRLVTFSNLKKNQNIIKYVLNQFYLFIFATIINTYYSS